MKLACSYATLLAGLLAAGCAGNPESTLNESKVRSDTIRSLASLPRSSLLETGRTYFAEVKRETAEKHADWRVQNPPIPPHYAIGFEWLNLSNVNNPRDGLWIFTVKDIERWHDPDNGGPMGTFLASYKCEVLTIKNAQK